MKCWYTVHTKPRQETVAEENLQRQGFPVYLPRIQAARRKKDRWQDVIEPLFPRYLFMQVDAETVSLAPVRSTRGVNNLVRFGYQLVPVPDELIACIKSMEDQESGLFIPKSPLFNTGDRVSIVEGPFAQMEGIYHCDQGEHRAIILLECLGRLNTITVSRHSLAHAS